MSNTELGKIQELEEKMKRVKDLLDRKKNLVLQMEELDKQIVAMGVFGGAVHITRTRNSKTHDILNNMKRFMNPGTQFTPDRIAAKLNVDYGMGVTVKKIQQLLYSNRNIFTNVGRGVWAIRHNLAPATPAPNSLNIPPVKVAAQG